MTTTCQNCPACSQPVLDPADTHCMSCGAVLPMAPPANEDGDSSVVPDLIESALDLLPDMDDLF